MSSTIDKKDSTNDQDFDDTRSLASTVLPSYGADVSSQPPPTYQPVRRLPPDLHMQSKNGDMTKLTYSTGDGLVLVQKQTTMRPNMFLHRGLETTSPVVVSSKMTTRPIQERFCFGNHETSSGLAWTELVKSQDLSVCTFKLPLECGGRNLAWHVGNAKEKFKGPWILEEVSANTDTESALLCTFERSSKAGQGTGTFKWLREVSEEEEWAAIIALMITYRKLRDAGKVMPLSVAMRIGEASLYLAAGAVYVLGS